MSKKLGGNIGISSWGSGYVLEDYQLSHLEGRILTLVESWGLRETQEKACKDLVRNELWNLLTPCFVISGEDHTALRVKYQNEGRGSIRGPMPRIG